MAKKTWIKVAGVWKEVLSIWEKLGGAWQPGIVSWIKVGQTWKDCMVYAGGADPTFGHNPAWSPGWSVGPTASGVYSGTTIGITGTPNGFYSGAGTLTMYVWVMKAGVWVGNVLSFGAKDGTAYSQTITGLPAMTSSLYQIYYDSVDRHLE